LDTRLSLALGLMTIAAFFARSAGAGVGPSMAAIAPARAGADVFNYDRFGAVNLYPSRGRVRDVVLLVSGEAGWDAAAITMAERLATKGAIVAGIDLKHYREQVESAAESCITPSSDFENLSHYLQSKLGVKKYLEPSLIGIAAGATWV